MIEGKAVTGHTGFVAAVVEAPSGVQGDPLPIHYGLATLRVDYLFGLVSKSRPLDESFTQLVFAWAEGAPDPREAASLWPTGDFARVTDRQGVHWTVYELSYREDAATSPQGPHEGEGSEFYTYAVALGPLRTLEDGSFYNHVFTYRPDRLVAPLQEADAPSGADPAQGAPAMEPPLDMDAQLDTLAAKGVLDHDRTRQFSVITGVGPAPASLGLGN